MSSILKTTSKMPPIKKKRRKKSKNYFTQETEDAIVLYNSTSDFDEFGVVPNV